MIWDLIALCPRLGCLQRACKSALLHPRYLWLNRPSLHPPSPAAGAPQAWLRHLRSEAPRCSAFMLAVSFMLASIQRFEQPVTDALKVGG